MREELIRVLDYKLNDITNDIEKLIDLNNKIETEKEKSNFVSKILDTFKENDSNNLMNLVKIDKNDFERALELAGNEVKDSFASDSCNYEGLIYLINGINKGITLTLTDEQENSIKYLIDTLIDRRRQFDSSVDGYSLVKSRYVISDISKLEEKKADYSKTIEDVNNEKYIKNIELLREAIDFSSLSSERTISLLSYVLEYNADIYKKYKDEVDSYVEEEKEDNNNDTNVLETNEKEEQDIEETNEINEKIPLQDEVEENSEEEEKIYNEEMSEEKNEDVPEFHFNDIEKDKIFDEPISFDEVEKEDNNNDDETVELEINEKEEEITPDFQEINYIPEEEKEEVSELDDMTYVPATDEIVEPLNEGVSEVSETTDYKDETLDNIDADFNDVVSGKEDYDDAQEEKNTTEDLQKLFSKYGIEDNTILNELIDGNIEEYQNILDLLKDNSILDYFKNNKELLLETLLYSNSEVIDKVLKIVKNDLSVDDEDYGITLKIVINTIPSVFIKDGGNYDNFVKNIELYKDLEINLINLFDFSKEVFIAENENVKKNFDVVRKYDFDIDYKNAKYFLLIPNIGDKIDFYIESLYDDKEKNQKFDGIDYIKNYAAKLNVVTMETIKRLRYCSENGKKVFGSKPGSLSGEITNLKVNALDISDEYLNKFFNNEFDNLTFDEVREYVKLIHNSSNVGDYSDELDKLKTYSDDLRYNFEGVIVSYNKVVRNYNILRSYGIDSKKALQFAVCYNLVITKEEYNKLNSLLEKIGGNV